ncbi:amino acid ABC transporter ATP-binding protein [Pantoea sp. A4]|uniref:amino acid ABC transporter ATP-binding protein n=1 Tax=Pantoea sp. A4 TaxID=1225184 RepID=UPI0004747878|nr:amino acid ABC transporter ATP-binding protein [Pantoea sp. A4]
MISVQGINKRFHTFQALADINFSVAPQEVVSIIGPSGSGKSTLLRSLNLLVKPDSGKMTIADINVDMAKISHQEINQIRQKTSMVFQHYNLFRNKTALENITEVLRYGKKLSARVAREQGLHYLNTVGLSSKADAYPATLSGGQQQRVGIARALSLQPEVILMDEPTSSLDPEMRRGVLRLISDIAQQKLTMVIVTHEMSFAREISDRLFFMEQGKITAQGNPEQFFNHEANSRIGAFVNDYEI